MPKAPFVRCSPPVLCILSVWEQAWDKWGVLSFHAFPAASPVPRTRLGIGKPPAPAGRPQTHLSSLSLLRCSASFSGFSLHFDPSAPVSADGSQTLSRSAGVRTHGPGTWTRGHPGSVSSLRGGGVKGSKGSLAPRLPIRQRGPASLTGEVVVPESPAGDGDLRAWGPTEPTRHEGTGLPLPLQERWIGIGPGLALALA